MTTHTSTGLIRALEIWRPDESGERLSLAASHYGGGALCEQRSAATFQRGAGLVGRAWESCAPVFGGPDEGDFEGQFVEDRPTQLVAIPCGPAGACSGVVLLHCDDQGHAAAELWRVNDRNELALAENWYANLERFGRISQLVKFPRRAGMPGKVWADRFPRVMGSLATSPTFVRAAGAKAEGLSTAVGIPFMKSALDLEAVLVLLSAAGSPLMKVVEVWAEDPEEKRLKIVSADYGPYVDLAAESRRRRLSRGEGLAGLVYRDAAPRLTTDLKGVEFPRGQRFVEYCHDWGLGLPVYVGDKLVAAVTLFG